MGQDRESLRDLDGVRVAVEALTAVASGHGLSVDMLQQSVEGRLRGAGIRVLTSGDFPTGDPFLRVRVEVSAEVRGTVAYSVDTDFVQMTFMRRNPAVTFNRAQTWRASSRLGLVEPADLVSGVMGELAAEVDQFVSEYQAVNPRRQ